MSENEKDVKKKKQKRKMTKILGKAWGNAGAEAFQDSGADDDTIAASSQPLDLKSIGQLLDSGGYCGSKSGWEKFASDIGGVYKRHFAGSTKQSKRSKNQFEFVCQLLQQIDPSLADIASKLPVPTSPELTQTGNSAKKRSNSSAFKKQNQSPQLAVTFSETGLVQEEREHRAMNALQQYVNECGGSQEMIMSFRAKVFQRNNNKFEAHYVSPEGKILRSKADVARSLNLTNAQHQSSGSGTYSHKIPAIKGGLGKGQGKPRNQRECEAERKRLRKELDKVLKNHRKASKALDDFRSDPRHNRYPIDDDVLMEEEEKSTENTRKSEFFEGKMLDFDSFSCVVDDCITPDLIMTWDFLCTFQRTLSLDPIKLDDFVSALAFKKNLLTNESEEYLKTNSEVEVPLYLVEAHLALLRLLVIDPTSELWWWSTLETDDSEVKDVVPGSDTDRKRSFNASVNGTEEQYIPFFKCDMATLLATDEDSSATTRWLQALEDVRQRKTNAGGAIKSCAKSAASITSNPLVKLYLKKSLRKWKSNSAGPTKRAIIYLIDKVREARPDLWGRSVTKEDLAELAKKVSLEAQIAMQNIEEDAEDEAEGDSMSSDSDSRYEDDEDDDDDSYEDDDIVNDDYDTKLNATKSKKVRKLNECKTVSSIAAASVIPVKPPPCDVDLLLPPSKPILNNTNVNTHLISPFTWQCLTGAVVQRLLHRYKRLRNEVDDSLRMQKQLPALTSSEREKRELKAAGRIFSECIVFKAGSVKSEVETATEYLCSGKSYANLSIAQKVCIFRVLIEAAYDTHKIAQCVEDNFRARQNAVKALENEERRAKKEARQETILAEQKARERLAGDAVDAFLKRKRREVIRRNKSTKEFTADFIESLTDDDIKNFDDETTAEFGALPTPESFSKSEVTSMVAKIHEEDAFETQSLLVLTMEEIDAREREVLASMEDELNMFGNIESVYENRIDRETSAKIDRLQKDIESFKAKAVTLVSARAAACDALQDAVEAGTAKALRAAIKVAKMAQLSGFDDATNGIWAIDLLRDAALELKAVEKQRRVTDARKDLVAKLNKCFVRTQPMGEDRHKNSYWHFDGDEERRVWIEQGISTAENEHAEAVPDLVNAIGDEEEDLLLTEWKDNSEAKKCFLSFSRKEYQPCGLYSSLPQKKWGCSVSDRSLRLLIKGLDERGLRERKLKSKLKEIVDSSVLLPDKQNENSVTRETSDHTADNYVFKSSGDEVAYEEALNQFINDRDSSADLFISDLRKFSSVIEKRVRLKKGETVSSYYNGTIIGWSKEGSEISEEETDVASMTNGVQNRPSYVWQVTLDFGGEENLSSMELIEGLLRHLKWKTQYVGYDEPDSSLYSYRNTMGKFCGRACDAPHASTTSFFARLLIKRESELYMPLKNRSYDNNWGGKCGARNAWIAYMRENAQSFTAVQEGLLTLENALFDLTEVIDENNQNDDVVINGRSLLDDEKFRFDIELESMGDVNGLWNSKEARSIFLELMKTTESIGFLSLGLDLICRNCKSYLDSRPTTSRPNNEYIGTRRQNALQLQNSYYN
mmetsp:Transcript_27717/g.31999  ORF Transcript_27717/g.31999 Transcript_27717/m.31999 type:complete len:1553 (+) Transcript_27717:169-4827(+)